MAIDKLGLYNSALALLGQSRLDTLTENRSNRHKLDDVWDLGAAKYCLEIVKPVFARKTVTLNSPVTSPDHGLDSVHTLPGDYITLINDKTIYSDDKLDQSVYRYIIDGDKLSCEHAIVYVRYVSDDAEVLVIDWAPSFVRVVAAYIAREASININPSKYEEINTLFMDRVESAIKLDESKEVANRSSAPTVTLTNDWFAIYNDALLVLDLDEITSNTDDSNRRIKLDKALNGGVVEAALEDAGWTFATITTETFNNPSLEPSWGYRNVFDEPNDMLRIWGLFYDEYMQVPVKEYKHENKKIYADENVLYIQYVSRNWLTNPSLWPMFFRRMVASKMAMDASGSLAEEGADYEKCSEIYEDRKDTAQSIDAMSSPPRRLSNGRWSRGRFTRSNRNRP